MEIDPRVFVDFMRKASYGWKINPVILSFVDEGVKIQQVDQARIYFSSSLLRIACDQSGTIAVVEDFAKMLKKCFKKDSEVSLTLKDKYIIFAGNRELYTYNYEEPPSDCVIPDEKVHMTEYGTLPEAIAKGIEFSFDTYSDELKDLPSGRITLEGSGEEFKVKAHGNVSEYMRKIDGTVVKSGGACVVVDNFDIPFTGKLRVSIVPGSILILHHENANERYTIAIAGRVVE